MKTWATANASSRVSEGSWPPLRTSSAQILRGNVEQQRRSRRPRRRRCRRGGASSAGRGSPARSARGSASRPCGPRRRSRRRPCPRRWAARPAAGRPLGRVADITARGLGDWVLLMLTSRVPRLLRAGARRVDESGNYRDGPPTRSAEPAIYPRICRGKSQQTRRCSAPGHRLVAAARAGRRSAAR